MVVAVGGTEPVELALIEEWGWKRWPHRWLGQPRKGCGNENSIPISLGIYVKLCDYVLCVNLCVHDMCTGEWPKRNPCIHSLILCSF